MQGKGEHMKKVNERRGFLSKALAVGVGGIGLLTLAAEARGRQGGRGGRGNGNQGSGNQGGGNQGGGNTGGGDTGTILTEAQEASIVYMYQEEKVARDVYSTLGRLYPSENTFANIQLSEQKHIDAVEVLCINYGIDISAINEDVIGEFILPELQELYDTLIIKGQESLLDALYVGEEIEIKDITDLVEASIGMPADVQNVFANLKAGSENHLRAFQRAIARESR